MQSEIKSDIKVYSTEDFPSYLPKLNHLYDTLFSGGKGFRGELVTQMARFAEAPDEISLLLAQTVEFIHNSSLLHDDLIDKSPLRRGKTAAWKEFGPEYAVLAGDYLLARIMVNLSNEGHVGLLKITSQSISDLLEGEWLQDSTRHSVDVVWEDMDRIHRLKTASLFAWCLSAPFIYKNADPAVIKSLSDIGINLGLLLQRSDDLLDFDIRNGENKTTFTDLKAGYLNLFSLELFTTKESKEKAYKVTNKLDLFKMISEEEFLQKLKAFDEKNEKLLLNTLNLAQSLKGKFKGSDEFYEFIKEAAPQLYWRS